MMGGGRWGSWVDGGIVGTACCEWEFVGRG